MWTVVDDDNDIIQIRASINVKTQAPELKKLIMTLVNRHPDLQGMSTLNIELKPKELPHG